MCQSFQPSPVILHFTFYRKTFSHPIHNFPNHTVSLLWPYHLSCLPCLSVCLHICTTLPQSEVWQLPSLLSTLCQPLPAAGVCLAPALCLSMLLFLPLCHHHTEQATSISYIQQSFSTVVTVKCISKDS